MSDWDNDGTGAVGWPVIIAFIACIAFLIYLVFGD